MRKAIHSYYQTNYELTYQPETEIIVTSGASEAIDITFRTILTPGDEVILPSPIYPGYEPLITLANAKPVHVNTAGTEFKFTPETIADAITEKRNVLYFHLRLTRPVRRIQKLNYRLSLKYLKEKKYLFYQMKFIVKLYSILTILRLLLFPI